MKCDEIRKKGRKKERKNERIIHTCVLHAVEVLTHTGPLLHLEHVYARERRHVQGELLVHAVEAAARPHGPAHDVYVGVRLHGALGGVAVIALVGVK